MKHNLKITVILLVMFLITQFIGLFIVSYYSNTDNTLPYGLAPPELEEQDLAGGFGFLASIVIAFIFAIILVFVLINIKTVWVMRIWFFIVVILALGITFSAVLNILGYEYTISNIPLISSCIAIILAYFKIFQRNIVVHNLTELAIYPGIAAIFVPILNIWTIILLLILISAYDVWAVWHSGIMQKMAKFQINKVGVLGGFFVPYADKKTKQKIKLLRNKYKNNKIPESVIKKNNIKVNLAILGGGDIIFPIIAAGVFLKTFNNLWATLIVILGATLALLYLFTAAKKKKWYPAMPFITTGLFLGMIAAKILLIYL